MLEPKVSYWVEWLLAPWGATSVVDPVAMTYAFGKCVFTGALFAFSSAQGEVFPVWGEGDLAFTGQPADGSVNHGVVMVAFL